MFYHCKVFCQVRHREARQKKLLEAHRIRSERERTAVDKLWPWPEVQRCGDSVLDLPTVPRRPRSRGIRCEPQDNPDTSATQVLNPVSSGIAEGVPCLVPVIMSTTSCTQKKCRENLKEAASELCAPRQGIRCVGTSGWFVQTQLNLSAGTAAKLREITAKQCSEITIQLGRWRACCLAIGKQTVNTRF